MDLFVNAQVAYQKANISFLDVQFVCTGSFTEALVQLRLWIACLAAL